jgi:hypothetical protein
MSPSVLFWFIGGFVITAPPIRKSSALKVEMNHVVLFCMVHRGIRDHSAAYTKKFTIKSGNEPRRSAWYIWVFVTAAPHLRKF